MTAQLRMYRAKEGELETFVEEWRSHVVPLREAFGFRIEGAWVVPAERRFVWIVSYEGPEGFEARDRAYYASEERKALAPDPARHLEETRHWLMEAVPSRPPPDDV